MSGRLTGPVGGGSVWKEWRRARKVLRREACQRDKAVGGGVGARGGGAAV